MPKADGNACDDDKRRKDAVRDVVGVDETEPVDCVRACCLSCGNGNDLVPLGGRVSEGMSEALGLEIDTEALSS